MSGRVDSQAGALKLKADLLRIGSGGDDEGMLQVAAVAVVDEIDAAVDIAVVDAAVCGNVGNPLFRICASKARAAVGSSRRPV